MDPRIAEAIFLEDERKRLQEEGFKSPAWKSWQEYDENKIQDQYGREKNRG